MVKNAAARAHTKPLTQMFPDFLYNAREITALMARINMIDKDRIYAMLEFPPSVL